MKRTVSIFLALLFSFMSCFSAFALDGDTLADNISVIYTGMDMCFTKTQYAKFSFKIKNSSEAVGASARIYIDGFLQSDAGSPYFTIYDENNEIFDVYIPSELDVEVEHTLTLNLAFPDKSEKNTNVKFSVNKTLPKIKAEIVSAPLSVSNGNEIYFLVKFTFSDARFGYRIRTGEEINGVRRNELDKTINVGNGETVCFAVPGEYTDCSGINFNYKITVNPYPQYGEATASASKSIIMANAKGQEYEYLNSVITPVLIRASVIRDSNVYNYASLTGYANTLRAGTNVTYLNPDNHESMKSAKIKTDSGSTYWIPMSNITILTGDYVIADTLTTEQKEIFVNGRGYESETPYLLWVNLQRQILTVFIGEKGNWKYLNCFPVASGKNATPTPTTQHRIEYVTRWVTPTYICDPVLSLFDGYAIHNQPVSLSGYVTDSTIGRPASAGCVRMRKSDVDWVRYYVPIHTNVVIY